MYTNCQEILRDIRFWTRELEILATEEGATELNINYAGIELAKANRALIIWNNTNKEGVA